MVRESDKWAEATVERTNNLDVACTVAYETVSGTAHAGADFVHAAGTLTFQPMQRFASVRVWLIEDNEPEDDETFTIVLSNPRDGAILGPASVCTITIADDDNVGVLCFEMDRVTVNETEGEVVLSVRRENGSCGEISCAWETKEIGSAVVGHDFEAAKGTLVFGDGVTVKKISVPVIDDGRYEQNEQFQVALSDPQGCSFKANVDGGPDQCLATITITSDDERSGAADALAAHLNFNVDNIRLGASNWVDQYVEAVTYEGGGFMSFLLYVLSIPWKLLVACVPPTRLNGGWTCFFVCLCLIGVITALIGDLANHVGCCLQLPAAVTAITFVALGTSLPDTFASQTAAANEPYADNAIGNVTGSNAVNVFLGLGLPWMIAAIYWSPYMATPEKEAEWHARYASAEWYVPGTPMGFAVPAGDLGFTVLVFSSCATLCIGLLVLRRATLGFELGGAMVPKALSAVLCVLLWLLYLALSIAAENSLLPPAVTGFPFNLFE